MPEPTIAAGAVRALLELAVSRGASRRSLTERSRIDPTELRDRDQRIPLAKYEALMRAGQELCHDPALALHFGESIDVAELSPFLLIVGGSETMAEGFALMNRYARLTVEVEADGSGDRFVLRRGGGQLWMVDTRRNPNDFPELTESTFARMVCATRRALGDEQFVKAVHVTHPAPVYRAEYDRIFRMPVVFESDRNALLLADAVATWKPPSLPRPVLDILSAHAEKLLTRLERSKSMRGRVENLLRPILHTGDASVEVIAGRLGLSRQTLFRRLRAEGVTYQKVLDDLRHSMALHYLVEQRLPVHQAASLVGFSEPGAFSRAFKRWTGSSPRTYVARRVASAERVPSEPPRNTARLGAVPGE